MILFRKKNLIEHYYKELEKCLFENNKLKQENVILMIQNVLLKWKIEEVMLGNMLEILNETTAILIRFGRELDRSEIDHGQAVDFYLFNILEPVKPFLGHHNGLLHASKHKEHIKIIDIRAKEEDVGIGSLLLHQLINYASSQPDIKYLSGSLSEVDAERKQKLTYFYEKHGFQITLDSPRNRWWGRIRKDICH